MFLLSSSTQLLYALFALPVQYLNIFSNQCSFTVTAGLYFTKSNSAAVTHY